MQDAYQIIPLSEKDISQTAAVHSKAFARQKASNKWIACNHAAFPRILIYIAKDNHDNVLGYIQWLQKSGFREETVLELEQIAVLPDVQGQGIGCALIKKSLEQVKEYLNEVGSKLKAVMVTTRTDNAAQILYKKALGAEKVGMIKELYSDDEVIMLTKF